MEKDDKLRRFRHLTYSFYCYSSDRGVNFRVEKDFTVVIVTHSMSQAARVSDYTGFMYLGRLVEFDKTEKIFSDPDNELTKRYITEGLVEVKKCQLEQD